MSRYANVFTPVLSGATPFGGDRILAQCPFHDDREPSLSVDLASGLWHCFGCGEKGNAKTFAKRMRLGDIPRPPASLDKVRQRIKSLRRRDDYAPPPEASISTLYPGADVWWNFRGVPESSVRKWELGYDPMADALLIPVRSAQGAAMGIIRRYLAPVGQQPKYNYPAGFPRRNIVYGLHKITTKWAVITEGALDAVAVDAAGFPAIATLGVRISREQIELIRKAGITTLVLGYDNDDAGRKAVDEAPVMLRGFRRITIDWSGISAKDFGELPTSEVRDLIFVSLSDDLREEIRTTDR